MQHRKVVPIDLMGSILPQIVNDDNALKFIETNLNESGQLHLRVVIGQLYNSYVGLYTGHYSIDLKNIEQKNGARR